MSLGPPPRRPRPTLRCVVADFALPLPPLTVDLVKIAEAREDQGKLVVVQLDGRVDVRLEASAPDELWIGVRTISADGETLKSAVWGVLFQVFMDALGLPHEYEDAVVWAEGEPLPFWEVARLVIT